MHVQCYHFETRTITERDAQGNTRFRTEQVRVNTHSASEKFYYQTWRDISGRFVLDTSGAQANEQKAFVKLHLKIDLQFANDGTALDYERQRESFKWRNNRDTHQEYKEERSIEGFKEFNLVKVGDLKPKCFGLAFYILFMFLTVVEFYKVYVDKFCIDQEFTITKVVSSKGDLNRPELFATYQTLLPCIVYLGAIKTYDAPCISVKMEMPSYEINVSGPAPVVSGQVTMAMPTANVQVAMPTMNVAMNTGTNMQVTSNVSGGMNMSANFGAPGIQFNAQANTPLLH
jgi:hypothetical protein